MNRTPTTKKTCTKMIFEVAPSLYMVEVRKSGGDTLEFHKAMVPRLPHLVVVISLPPSYKCMCGAANGLHQAPRSLLLAFHGMLFWKDKTQGT
ncbi:hypothetical protein CIPAW_09G120400 [Carya illinoinensis]|uniref:Uncharacterized protein n=1 Tax=Carya illinoinensis TaxID=32201 RepID=A0A8T1PJF6_CARIL|nr:hypothetical protein CIPAW_09G120400 [Carya illinoinensis]